MQNYSAAVGGLMGITSAAIQYIATPVFNVNALIVPLASAIIGGLMSYAVLRNTVSRMEKDVRDIRREIKDMNDLCRDMLVKLSHLEGRMESQRET